MHAIPPGVWVTFAISFLVPLVSTLSIWRTLAAQRANGRKAVEARLADLGETPVSIERLPFSAVVHRTGLAGTVTVFRVVAARPDGRQVEYEWAYEPALVHRQHRALKRLAHGIWIPVA